MIETLKDLLKTRKDQRPMKIVLAASQDREALKAVVDAAGLNIVEPVLVGDISETERIANNLGIDISKYERIDVRDLVESAGIAVKLVSQGKADFLMKGLIDTSILLKQVLNREYGLRTDSLLSHVMVYEVPTYHKILILTDGGMNIEPNLEEKTKIIKNAVAVSRALGNRKTKVAVLAAKEKVNPKMIATIDADALKLMGHENHFGEDVIIDGPLALDLAVSKEAADIKGFRSPVSGDADIIVVPNIEMGNGIGKSLTYFAKGKSAGIIMGAKVPIVLVSRADDNETKLYSIALGSLIAGNQ